MDATKMKDELFDQELCEMVKFTDATTTEQKPTKAKKKNGDKEHAKEKKVAQNPTNNPVDAKYKHVKTWYDKKAVNMVKWVVVFMGLEYLFFYWQQTGQMQSTAAMPSMIACALLAGISVGKNWKWKS